MLMIFLEMRFSWCFFYELDQKQFKNRNEIKFKHKYNDCTLKNQIFYKQKLWLWQLVEAETER